MDAALALGDRNTLDSMYTGFPPHRAVGAFAFDLEDCFLHSAERAVRLGNDFDAPATTFGEAGVHAVKIRGKDGGFVAAGAAANLNDGRTVVERVVGNECWLYLFQ